MNHSNREEHYETEYRWPHCGFRNDRYGVSSTVRGGYYILVVAVIIVAYGGTAIASPNSRGLLVSVHVAFVLTLSSFFMALPGEPFVFWAVAPLTLLLSYAIFGHTFANSHQANLWHLITFFPLALLIPIAIVKEWAPPWYPVAALVLYSLLLLDHKPKTVPDRTLIGACLALSLVSLGLLVDVSDVPIPDWAADSSSGGFITFLVQASIFVGCGMAGLALPFLLLKEE
jgi:hypothetical protein